MSVRVERDGEVWTVVLARPEVRNAIDRETAEELARAFRAFEAEPEARVGVLWGEGGCFSAGADLTAIAGGRPNRVALAMGLADRVVSDGESRPAAEALAREIAEHPWTCLANDRRSLYEGLDLPFEEALENETRLGLETLREDGGREAARRFWQE